MKLFEIIGSVDALNKLAECKLPAKTAFAVAKIIRAVGQEVEVYEKTRILKLEQYGVKNTETNQYEFNSPEDASAFNQEFNDFLSSEVELKFTPIKVETLTSVDVEPRHLLALSWLVEE